MATNAAANNYLESAAGSGATNAITTTQSSALTQLQISSTPIDFVEYGHFLVQIYEKANQCNAGNPSNSTKLYYYSPLSLLDIESVKAHYNPFNKQHGVKFNVEMWSEEIQKKVMERLKSSGKVQVLPYEEVMLNSSMDTEDCRLDYDRKPSSQLHKFITFNLTCSSEEKAKEVAQNIREYPDCFTDGLRLFLRLSSIVTRKSQTRITIDINSDTKIASKLVQKHPNASEVLMTKDGTERLLNELASILVESYDEIGEAAQGQNGFSPYEMLEKMLVESRKTMDKGDVAWDSVFWIDENCRPDVVCHEVNDMFKKLSTEDQDKLASEFSKEREGKVDSSSETGKKRFTDLKYESINVRENDAKNVFSHNVADKSSTDHKSKDEKGMKGEGLFDVKVGGRFQIGKLGGSGNHSENRNMETRQTFAKESNDTTDSTSKHHEKDQLAQSGKTGLDDSHKVSSSQSGQELDSGSLNTSALRNRLMDNKSHIELDGKRFVPKSMDLVRINVGKIRSRQVFNDLRTKASYIVASICLPVNIAPQGQTIYDKMKEIQRENEEKMKILEGEHLKMLESHKHIIESKNLEVRNLDGTIQVLNSEIQQLKNENLIIKESRHEEKLANESLIENQKEELENQKRAIESQTEEILKHLETIQELNLKLKNAAESSLETQNIGNDQNEEKLEPDTVVIVEADLLICCNECDEENGQFRYICIQCPPDYDLCSGCSTTGCHPEHFIVRFIGEKLPDFFPVLRELKDEFDLSTLTALSMSYDGHEYNLPQSKCGECDEDIIGFRYNCLTCPDFDLCSSCEADGGKHPDHPMIRSPEQEPALSFVYQHIVLNRIKEMIKTE